MTRPFHTALALVLALVPVSVDTQSRPAAPAPARTHETWGDYGSGPDNSKYIRQSQITKANVGTLKVAWTYFNGASRFNPIVVDNVMYVLARNSSLVALDAATGKEIWIHSGLTGIATRGISYWESADRSDRRLIFQINSFIQEIDARTGKSILAFGKNGLVDLREGLGRDPKTVARIKSDTPGRVFENLYIFGSSTGENFLAPPGDFRAVDIRTGQLAWQFHTVPHPGEFGYETWPKDAWRYAGGVNTWGEVSLDAARGIVYFPTGSSTYDMYGADRAGTNLFANCLIALDARTGKYLWHFQTVHHDLWDYDLTSAPQLLTIRRNGQTIDAVAQASKTGFLFVFDRVTGKPVFPIEERPVPKSDVPGEQAWPTQPFPTVVPPFSRQHMTAADVNPFFLTAEERAEWTRRIQNARNDGLFTPPAYQRDTVQIPGARGGSNVGTTAADPERGLFFVLTQDYPSITNIEGTAITSAPLNAGRGAVGGAAANAGEAAYQQTCGACHGANRAGTANAPSLVGVAARLGLDEFRTVVNGGRGQMPALPTINAATIASVYAYLGGNTGGRGGGGTTAPMTGPVVASGGAPGGLEVGFNEAQMREMYGGNNRFVGPPYPQGVAAFERLYSNYGLQNGIIGPPWSEIVAYDLNTGAIKWKKPLGEDELAVAAGGKNTGMLAGGESRGMVVTSNGLVFVNAKDGRLRAFDAETGDVVWSYKLPAGTQGLPSMYQVNGKWYLVVPSSAGPQFGRNTGGGGGGAATAGTDNQGYIAFALP